MSIISLHNIGVSFGSKTVLENITFSIEKGEYIGLIGPNGAGKSTLLKTILGSISPSTGHITRKKQSIVGYVPQNYLLSTHFSISVEEVLEMALGQSFLSKNTQKITEALTKVGLQTALLKSNFQTLSGGQKQRVIIARSLLNNPDILLFDEPLSGVDMETKIQIYELLSRLNTTYKTTIIFVSHEIENIVASCSRVICLNKKLHEGCHPIDFAKGNIDACNATSIKKNITPIHHHHSLTTA